MSKDNPITKLKNAITHNKHVQTHTKTAIDTLNRVISNYIYNENHPYGYQKTTTNTRFLPANSKTAQECAMDHITKVSIESLADIEDWLNHKTKEKTLEIAGVPTNAIIGAGYNINKHGKITACTTNFMQIIFERTDDENGYRLTTAYPSISKQQIEKYRKTHPKYSYKPEIAITSNPKILKHLEDTPIYKEIRTDKKRLTDLLKINALRKPRTTKEPKPYTDPYRSYAMEESKHRPTMAEHVDTIKDTKPKTPESKTDDPDYK